MSGGVAIRIREVEPARIAGMFEAAVSLALRKDDLARLSFLEAREVVSKILEKTLRVEPAKPTGRVGEVYVP